MHCDLYALFLTLCFDNTDRLLVNEEDVIGRPDICDILPHCNANTGREIDLRPFLNSPTTSGQLLVDIVAGFLLGVLVGCGHTIRRGSIRLV